MLRSKPAILLVALLALAATLAGWLRPVDHTLAELRFQLTARQPTDNIVLVDIDAKSISAEGRWPWPRSVHAALVDELRALGAAEIAFDVDFSAYSNPADDAAFAAALERAGGSVILAALDQKSTARPTETLVVHNRPIEAFAKHAWIASLNVDVDPDGKVRRLNYASRIDGEALPTLAAILGGRSGDIEKTYAIDFGIRADAIDRVSVVDVLRGRVAEGRIAGRKVIVGASAAELRDFFVVPVYGSISGSLLQAMGAESVAQGRALVPTGAVVSIVGVLILSLLFLGLGQAKWVPSLVLLAFASLTVEIASLAAQNMWPVMPVTAALQAALFGFALLTLLREIDFRRVLILIARNQTQNTQTILDRVVEDNFAGVVVVDERGTIRAASRKAAEILEARAELFGQQANALLPLELCDAMRNAIEAARRGDFRNARARELSHARRAGQSAILEYTVTPSCLAGGLGDDGRKLPDTFVAALTFADVSEERSAAGRIAYLAGFDTLTGLPNRNQFVDALDSALRRMRLAGESCAVICFDLDRLKNLNDTLGIEAGDLVLKAVAGRARRLLPPGDIVARFGSDDFAIVCASGQAPARARELAETLAASLREPYDLDGRRHVVTASFGIAAAESGDEPLDLLKRADTALSAAKASGDGIARFDPAMAAKLRQRQILESELWEAFERRDFEIYYQPQVDLEDERILGFEALLRWPHPRFGFISPADFIPVAEASGLMQRLGAWVLEEACATAAAWPDSIRLSVNVSPIQFARGDLVRTVAEALSRSGLSPDRLELEITESLLLEESPIVPRAIAELRAMRVSFALDDFGTGYSSLNYVRKFPISKIKIDRAFVSEIPLSTESAAIVSAVAALARSLDLRLNAEGIETRDQLELLRLLGCAEGQGYLFGKPAPLAETEALIAAQMSPPRAAMRA
jgi:diguanylate cyclase (GGDEF)-like protein